MKTLGNLGLALVFCVSTFALPAPAEADGLITVNTLDGTSVDDGDCSIREAIEAAGSVTGKSANDDCAGGTLGTDVIAFDLPGSGVQTIPLTAAVTINTPVIMDGTTDPDFAGTPVVRLDGGSNLIYGLYLTSGASGSTFKGLMVTAFIYGELAANGLTSLTVVGNYLGTDGSSDLGGNTGVLLQSSSGVALGGSTAADRNIITGHGTDVRLNSGSTNVTIQGNYIGVYADGNTAPSGSGLGVELAMTGSPGTGASGNTIGGLLPGEGNVIAGHSTADIRILSDGQSFSDGNVIQGNIIGLNAAGTAAASVQSAHGVRVVNSDNTLIEGNVISKVVGYGIWVEWDPSYNAGGTPGAPDGTIIRGNRIGTTPDGMTALGSSIGIALADATNTIIGGQGNLGGRNQISGNNRGISVVGGSGNLVDTNWVGVDAQGAGLIPNTEKGVQILSGSLGISRTWIAGSQDAIYLEGTGTLSSASNNCLTGNTSNGVNNTTGSNVVFEKAWWGRASGPSGMGPGSGDAVSADVDFSPFLKALPAPCSVLQNASFEADADHNKKPDQWTFTQFSAATDKRDCSVHKSGSCSLKLAGNGNSKTASQTFVRSGDPGDVFSFSLWSKASVVPTGSVYRVQVKYYDGSTLLSTTTKSFAAGTHGFKQVNGAATAPASYTRVVFKITFQAASGTAWFDVANLGWAP